jgi:pimeloyl-ACP methyl ester carboxylesterase
MSADITGISGGPVLSAEYDQLERLAGAFAHAGLVLGEWLALPTATLLDPDLVASAALAPVSFAQVEARLGLTMIGPDSLARAAASWAELALGVIAARGVIEEIDSGEVQRLWTDADEVIRLRTAGLPSMDTLTAAAGGGLGLITAALGAANVSAGAGLLAQHQGRDTAITTRPVTVGPSAGPRDLADLTRHLGLLADAADGSVEVQTLTAVDGSIRHIVYLPGTDDMNPFSHDAQVRDMAENVRLIAGQPTAYGAGILAAMAQAGVRPGQPVLLVGHSQGGMQAVALASYGTPYDVTDVVTLGSPTAQIRHYPAGVQVLSLEHVGDAVPELDGAPASTDPAQVTVRFDDGVEGLVANHSYGHYLAGSRAVDASHDATIRANVGGLGNFLAPGQHATSHVFQITRVRGG